MTTLLVMLFLISQTLCENKRLLLDNTVVLHDAVQTLQSKVHQLESKLLIQKQEFQSIIQQLQVNVSRQEQELQLRRSNQIGSGSTTYIKWGMYSCSGDADLVYTGFTAGHPFSENGSATNYLCLPNEPQWSKYSDGFNGYSGRICGAEYETTLVNSRKDLFNYDVPCTLCQIPRHNTVMIPGRNTCYKGWTLEYSGYLMSTAYQHLAETEYICVNGNPEVVPNSKADTNGAVLYTVEVECTSLPCPPYVAGRELTCVVCSK